MRQMGGVGWKGGGRLNRISYSHHIQYGLNVVVAIGGRKVNSLRLLLLILADPRLVCLLT